MDYLRYLFGYFCFSATFFFSTFFFVDNRSFKRKHVKLRFGLYPVAVVLLCAVLAATYDFQIKYLKTDIISYSALGLFQFAFMLTALDMPLVKNTYIIISGIVLRHAASRIANCIVFYIPMDSLALHTLATTAIFVAVTLPIWFAFGKTAKFDLSYVPSVKQTVTFTVVSVIFLMSSYLEPTMSAAGVAEYVMFTVLEVTFCFATLIFQMSMYRHAQNVLRIEYESKLAAERVKQYENFRSVIDVMNIKYHDLKHQIRALTDGGATVDKNVLESIERTLSDYGAFVKTGNETLDTVLTEKSFVCNANGIAMSCKIDGTKLGFLSAEDIRAFFGNALDNAVEYLGSVDDVGNRYIHVDLTVSEYFIKITVENYFDGNIEFGKNGLPVSGKDDGTYHGFGTKSIAEIAERHGGAVAFKTENNTFKVEAIFPANR